MSDDIATNRRAYHNYQILEKIEAGIELKGTEVKSIRAGLVSLNNALPVSRRAKSISTMLIFSRMSGLATLSTIQNESGNSCFTKPRSRASSWQAP